jgi:hypothetical protein
MPKSKRFSQAKGYSGEREAVEELHAFGFLHARRDAQGKVDVIDPHGIPWLRMESKRGAPSSFRWRAAMRQASNHAGDGLPVVRVRLDRDVPFVIMEEATFLGLLKQLADHGVPVEPAKRP